MKFFVVFALAVVYVNAAELSRTVIARSADADAETTDFENDSSPDGSFRYGFKTSNGIQVAATGNLINPGTDQEALEIQGGATYTAPDGTVIETQYVAGPNGYQATGNAIPTPPPVPELILRALAYIEAHPPPAIADNNKITLVVKNRA